MLALKTVINDVILGNLLWYTWYLDTDITIVLHSSYNYLVIGMNEDHEASRLEMTGIEGKNKGTWLWICKHMHTYDNIHG